MEGKVPDFQDWRLINRKSLWWDPTRAELLIKDAKGEDKNHELWVAYINNYRDRTGLGDGCEYDLLGKGVVVKLWGMDLENGDFFDYFVILQDEQWLFFKGVEYAPVIGVSKLKTEPPHIVFSAATVRVEDRITEEQTLILAVHKDFYPR
jgi:hypothetical protein